jgi:hypothetical protein
MAAVAEAKQRTELVDNRGEKVRLVLKETPLKTLGENEIGKVGVFRVLDDEEEIVEARVGMAHKRALNILCSRS